MSSPSGNGQGRDRDGLGRFAPGNRGGPGNPHASKVAKLRAALLEAVTLDDVRDVLAALVQEAREGNVSAMKLFFDRTLGQPEAVDVLERMSELEMLLERAAASSSHAP